MAAVGWLGCTQESKYRDATRYYQPLIARNANNLLGVTAIVLANLCVSYIMTSQVSRLPRHKQPHCSAGDQPLIGREVVQGSTAAS